MKFNDLIDTIRKALVPIHREGWIFVAMFFVAAVVLGWFSDTLFWLGLGLTIWCALFFRDPQRVSPISDALVLAPADGKVSAIQQVVPPEELGLGQSPMKRVSIFMNVFNCHINRTPVRGSVVSIRYSKGSFLNAELDKASHENERNGLVIDGPHGRIGVVQVAGLVARRIVCWAHEGQMLAAGERFGLIRFGSRLDVYLPEEVAISVSLGQTTIAGETVLARHDEAPIHAATRLD